MAEGLFLQRVEEAGLSDRISVDSAGTSGHHAGEMADRRMRETASRHGIALTTRSRPLKAADFGEFDQILTMDRSVHRDVLRLQQERGPGKAAVRLMRDYDREDVDPDVPDPYYGGADGFEEVYQILDRSTATLLAQIRQTYQL